MIFRRGSLLSTAIFVYAATSPVNGYFGGGLYSRMGGKLWIRQVNIGNIYHFPCTLYRENGHYKNVKKSFIIHMYFRC